MDVVKNILGDKVEQKCTDCGIELLGYAEFSRMCTRCQEKHDRWVERQNLSL